MLAALVKGRLIDDLAIVTITIQKRTRGAGASRLHWSKIVYAEINKSSSDANQDLRTYMISAFLALQIHTFRSRIVRECRTGCASAQASSLMIPVSPGLRAELWTGTGTESRPHEPLLDVVKLTSRLGSGK